jgi:hypothetical protein
MRYIGSARPSGGKLPARSHGTAPEAVEPGEAAPEAADLPPGATSPRGRDGRGDSVDPSATSVVVGSGAIGPEVLTGFGR